METKTAVKTEAVQKLRENTSAGVMDCRKALIEANGDIDAAVKIIREKGLAKVRSARTGRRAPGSWNRISITSESVCCST